MADFEMYSSDEEERKIRTQSAEQVQKKRELIRRNTPRQSLISDAHIGIVEYVLEKDRQRRLASWKSNESREPLMTEIRLLEAGIALITGETKMPMSRRRQLMSGNADMTSSMRSFTSQTSQPWDATALSLALEICKLHGADPLILNELEDVVEATSEYVETDLEKGDLTLQGLNLYRDAYLQHATGEEDQAPLHQHEQAIKWWSAKGKSVRGQWYRLVESDYVHFSKAGGSIQETKEHLEQVIPDQQTEEGREHLRTILEDVQVVLDTMESLGSIYHPTHVSLSEIIKTQGESEKELHRVMDRLYMTSEEKKWLAEWGPSICDRRLLVETVRRDTEKLATNRGQVATLWTRLNLYSKFLKTLQDGSSDIIVPNAEKTSLREEIVETSHAFNLLSEANRSMKTH